MELPHIPHLNVQALPGYGPAPLFVGFMVSSSNPEAQFQTFRWNFGDGQVSTLPPTALFHTYTKPGSYVVSVTATTHDGHQATGFAGVLVKAAAR
jgi:PKD repeat protein